MTIMEIDETNKLEYLCQFILESRSLGLFLSPEDQALVEVWLENAAGDEQKVLLALDSVLPKYYGRQDKMHKTRMPLRRIDKTMKQKIAALRPASFEPAGL